MILELWFCCVHSVDMKTNKLTQRLVNLLSYIPNVLLEENVRPGYRTSSTHFEHSNLSYGAALYFKCYDSRHVRKRSRLEHLFYFVGKPRKAVGNSWVDYVRYFSFPCKFFFNLSHSWCSCLASLCQCRLI